MSVSPSAPLRRVLALPSFPAVSDDGVALELDPFSPNALLGGFVAGPENRLAELAVRFAVDGVPIFERPLGEPSERSTAAARFGKLPFDRNAKSSNVNAKLFSSRTFAISAR
jgi:hypothetical protein